MYLHDKLQIHFYIAIDLPTGGKQLVEKRVFGSLRSLVLRPIAVPLRAPQRECLLVKGESALPFSINWGARLLLPRPPNSSIMFLHTAASERGCPGQEGDGCLSALSAFSYSDGSSSPYALPKQSLNISISSLVVYRDRPIRREPSISRAGKPMASNTWLRAPRLQAELFETQIPLASR